jgi:tetratricopeptide (TPR) repeat protein
MSTIARYRMIALAGVGLFLVAAGQPPVADWIRDGNDAYARGDWDAAESLFTQAEERAADPGLVAFNKGAALYRRGDFRRAELSFRRTLGDADIPPERRARALYNLGNCLVRQAGDSDVKVLQAAIESYEMALHDAADEGVRTDTGHNLEVAKLLWAKARAKRPPGDRDQEWEDQQNPKRPPRDQRPPQDPGPDGMGDGPKNAQPGAKLELGKGPDAAAVQKETEKAAPGAGNVPVLPDDGTVKSIPIEDTWATLKKAGQRLERERRKLREEAAQGYRPRPNDW